ncbi:MAG: AAA family ATPase [Desulfurococcales archaeon]|nr:AAA family ATPase [Desulfurococcales archaeon]
MPVLVLVTGMPGSGKSTISRIIARELGARVYSMGDVVRREVERRGLDVTVENVERVAEDLRRSLGKAAVAILLLEELKGSEEDFIVVDGVRGMEEVEVLNRLGPTCIVAVHASPLTRFRRVLARSRRGDVGGWRDLVLRDRMNLRFGIGAVIALADYIIVNEHGMEEVEEEAVRVARVIRCGKGKGCGRGGGKAYGGSG